MSGSPRSTAAPTRCGCSSPTRRRPAGDVAPRDADRAAGPGRRPHRRLAPEALERTRVALADYAALIAAPDVERIRMVATSATRDAANRADFVAMVREHARRRARGGHRLDGGRAVLRRVRSARCPASTAPVLLVDIGGGSTEFVLGGDAGRVARAQHGRRLRADDRAPPARRPADPGADRGRRSPTSAPRSTRRARRAARRPARRSSASPARSPPSPPSPSACALRRRRDPRQPDHARRGSPRSTDQLLAHDHAERAAMPVMHPGRVDVIAPARSSCAP